MATVTQRTPATQFYKRLIMLGGLAVVVMVVLLAQLTRLTVVQGAELRQEAEEVLDRRTYLPTYRGRILDRYGRVLARDQASYDIAVAYPVITGAWSMEHAERAARRQVGGAWSAMPAEQQQDVIEQVLPEFRAREQALLSRICALGGITRDELDERLNAIRRRVQRMAAEVWENQRLAEIERLGGDPKNFQFEPRPIAEQVEAHTVLTDLPDETAFEFMLLAEDEPSMLEVRDARRRVHPMSEQVVSLDRSTLPKPVRSTSSSLVQVHGVLDHVLGTVREEVWKEDVERRPFRLEGGAVDLGGYRRGDVVGSTGLERVFEDHLRGLRGIINERRDTGQRTRVEPTPGSDLHLTIDAVLQGKVQGILSHEFGLTVVQPWHSNDVLPLGYPLNAAAVVLEVETGDVLAMVTMPTVAMGAQMTDKQRTFERPSIDRTVEAGYPPGSIIKPLVLTAAISEDAFHLGNTITCNGKYFEDRARPRCWIYREVHGYQTHGPLEAEDAIARSCNIFFYTLADRLDMPRLLQWYDFFGIGRRLDVGLCYTVAGDDGTRLAAGQIGGHLPSMDDVAGWRADGQYQYINLIMGIGQGPLTWTPMHAANAYATLARGGSVRDATIVSDDDRRRDAARRPPRPINSRAVDAALEGLRRSVMEHYGTSNHLRYADLSTEPMMNAEGVTIWCKTGTAQATLIDLNRDGAIDESERQRRLDHAWCVGLVGPEGSNRPLHAFAVIVEYGGSGGRVAGPIANQIIHVLQEEGYLPGANTTGSSTVTEAGDGGGVP